MDSKLTLKLESSIIEEAKKYAKKHQTSVSKMVENYLLAVTQNPYDQEITPLVKSLSGVIEIPQDEDQLEYTKFLDKKYQ
ncbi:DUF6364 family protein [Marinoscillum pacificum]|uniref:DUF6364 family protein n=1 Tax=Marinoscillum pacificum TaxID=392723 RepID=UPI0021584842|nr:DUF6364 family protein [Marinoscillum pacificum]